MKILLYSLCCAAMICLWACQEKAAPAEDPGTGLSPDERWGQLFVDVQMAGVFPDGKTFADCVPKFSTAQIMADYEKNKKRPEFQLKAFVLENFDLPRQYASGFVSDTSLSAVDHINALWEVLTRRPDVADAGSLIPLPNPYIVPGGRFGEVYYWDSYFTMLGLQAAGKTDMIEHMVDNFAYLIDTIGFIPNGNRTYYLGRSQPPFFASMVRLLAEMKGKDVLPHYLLTLEKEYAFWMDGSEKVNRNNPAEKSVVMVEYGFVLNRYWDNRDTPRPESYKQDVETAAKTTRPAAEVYRDLRAAATSGWDFCSRWLSDDNKLETIRTTAMVPPDLNALLYNLELTIADAYYTKGDSTNAKMYAGLAGRRLRAVQKYCWDAQRGCFMDYDFQNKQLTQAPSLATTYPLFYKMATPEQAKAVAAMLERDFLKPGGLTTTLINTGEQWDAPNGWAPLQWMAIQGLRNYGFNELADKIKNNWVALNVKVYKNTGKMVEKYNVMDLSLEAGGGEYPVQDGFGWTNGVLLRLLTE
ncbi:MAG: alpha,alpha-trehalase TreF [Saprospiraceae bacterium]|jgi:alpha,alpha-trehalase|nr:alpha,alpha-trehalase TreF [Saprospiraceae bacterium]